MRHHLLLLIIVHFCGNVEDSLLFARPRLQLLTRLLWLIRRQIVYVSHLQVGEALVLVHG